MRDFVTCSSPQSNGFSTEDVTTDTTNNTSSPTDDVEEDELTPSTCTSHKPTVLLHHPIHLDDDEDFVLLQRKQSHARVSIYYGASSHSFLVQFPLQRKAPILGAILTFLMNVAVQAAANSERNLWALGGEAASAAANCGPKLPSNFFELPTKQRLHAVKQVFLTLRPSLD